MIALGDRCGNFFSGIVAHFAESVPDRFGNAAGHGIAWRGECMQRLLRGDDFTGHEIDVKVKLIVAGGQHFDFITGLPEFLGQSFGVMFAAGGRLVLIDDLAELRDALVLVRRAAYGPVALAVFGDGDLADKRLRAAGHIEHGKSRRPRLFIRRRCSRCWLRRHFTRPGWRSCIEQPGSLNKTGFMEANKGLVARDPFAASRQADRF